MITKIEVLVQCKPYFFAFLIEDVSIDSPTHAQSQRFSIQPSDILGMGIFYRLTPESFHSFLQDFCSVHPNSLHKIHHKEKAKCEFFINAPIKKQLFLSRYNNSVSNTEKNIYMILYLLKIIQ